MQHFLVPSHVTSFFVPATGSAEQGVGTLHIPPSLFPSHVTSFFVPATGSAEQGVGTLHIPPSLFRLGKKYLPDECTKPTVNLLRKWFHTELMRLTRTESKLLSLMKVVDAHSEGVARRHYVLNSPADDARLAKELVRNVIGMTVPAVVRATRIGSRQDCGIDFASTTVGNGTKRRRNSCR